MNKKLYRDEYHKMVGGVCAGLAEYFEMDVTVVRLLFVFTVIIMGVGLIPYVVLWIVLPRKGYLYNNFNNPTVDYRMPPQQPGDPSATPPPVNQFSNNPFAANAYSDSSYRSEPIQQMPPQRSHAGIIVGVVLIMIGAIILIGNYDLLPNIDFEDAWPAVLVVVGAALIVSGQAKHGWQRNDPQNEVKTDPAAAATGSESVANDNVSNVE